MARNKTRRLGSRASGANPRALGTNPRARGTNPRATATQPDGDRTAPRKRKESYDAWLMRILAPLLAKLSKFRQGAKDAGYTDAETEELCAAAFVTREAFQAAGGAEGFLKLALKIKHRQRPAGEKGITDAG